MKRIALSLILVAVVACGKNSNDENDARNNAKSAKDQLAVLNNDEKSQRDQIWNHIEAQTTFLSEDFNNVENVDVNKPLDCVKLGAAVGRADEIGRMVEVLVKQMKLVPEQTNKLVVAAQLVQSSPFLPEKCDVIGFDSLHKHVNDLHMAVVEQTNSQVASAR